MIQIFVLFFVIQFSQSQSIQNCVEYAADTICKKCQGGYYLSKSQTVENGKIIPTIECKANPSIPQCKTFDGKVCIECKTGYTINSAGTECINCNPNGQTGCEECSIDSNSVITCHKCASNLWLSIDQKKCIDCTQDAYSNTQDCGRCESGKYFNQTTKSCQKCQENCLKCTSTSDCYECNNIYYLSNSKGSNLCKKVENCVEFVKGTCLKCQDGYQMKNGLCHACGNNCKTCFLNDDNTYKNCSVCNEGFVYTVDNGNVKCVKPSDLHCKNYSQTQGCLHCEDHYYLTSEWKCEKCSDNCNGCIGSKDNCLVCKDGYYFDENRTCHKKDDHCKTVGTYGCVECIAANAQDNSFGYYIPPNGTQCTPCNSKCKKCEGNPDHCTSCISGYILKKITEVQGKVHYTCVESTKELCSVLSNGYCIGCVDPYYLTSNSDYPTVCMKCDVSCSTCTDQKSCVNCANGYFIPKEEDNSTKLCRSVSEINKTCQTSTSGCTTCFAGYYKQKEDDWKCEKCPSECSECMYSSSKGKVICTNCPNDKQFVKDGVCTECKSIEHCLACSGTGCKTCEDGYEVSDGTCRRTDLVAYIGIGVGGGLVLIILIIIIIVLFSVKKYRENVKKRNMIKAYKIDNINAIELMQADNENFPLFANKFKLDEFQKSKLVVDTEYTDTIELANTGKNGNKKYTFIFSESNYTEKYKLIIEPREAEIPKGHAMTVTFKLIPLCTTIINEEIPIRALDGDNEDIAKILIKFESDMSLKLDDDDLKPQMPAIAEGGFGMVFRGTYRGRDVAIKRIKDRTLTNEKKIEFDHEISMLTQLRHTCVVEFIGGVYAEGKFAIVTEFAEYSSLAKIWKKNYNITYELKVKFIHDLAVALYFLHDNEYLHRDIKGENVLLFSLNTTNEVCGKLTDFGTCRNISQRSLEHKPLTQGVGTPSYMAPEVMQNIEYSYPSDIYSFAITMYETFIENHAFDESDPRFEQQWAIPQYICEGNRFDQPDDMNDDYFSIIQQCWDQEPENRPSMKIVCGLIEDLEVEGEIKFTSQAPKRDKQSNRNEIDENEQIENEKNESNSSSSSSSSKSSSSNSDSSTNTEEEE